VHMISKNERSRKSCKEVAKYIFKRVSVLRSNSNSYLMSVVHLVNMFVQEGCVQHAMGETESKIFHHNTEQDRASKGERPRDPFCLHGVLMFFVKEEVRNLNYRDQDESIEKGYPKRLLK